MVLFTPLAPVPSLLAANSIMVARLYAIYDRSKIVLLVSWCVRPEFRPMLAFKPCHAAHLWRSVSAFRSLARCLMTLITKCYLHSWMSALAFRE